PRDVGKSDLGVGGLLRLEDPREGVDALIGHTDGADPQFTAEADGDVEPGHRIENSGLARSGKANQSDSHALVRRRMSGRVVAPGATSGNRAGVRTQAP